jgi:hypothetical protein
MSLSPLDQISPPSDFKPILDAALSEYKKKTGKELLDDPLATELRRCVSVDAILAILHGQAKAFQQFRDGDKRLMKWIGPLVHVLFAFSETLGEGVSLVRRLRDRIHGDLKYTLTSFHRRSPLQKQSLLGLASFLAFVFSPSLSRNHLNANNL